MAASKTSVKVAGVREVQSALKAVAAGAGDLKAAHMRVSSMLVPGVALRTPRRTGELAASWQAGATKTRARITSPLLRAGPIEYGWPAHGIEPARMVRETVTASSTEIVDTYREEIAKLGESAHLEVKP